MGDRPLTRSVLPKRSGSRRPRLRPVSGATTAIAALGLLCASLLTLSGCQTVEATGRRRLTLISTEQEIRMGRDVDRQIVATMGLYPDEGLQGYMQELGSGLAAVSERPTLPWSFRVLDDELINAFAAPGGFIFVTRGILAYCNNEAELIGVLGHEIGHVTAKHTVIKLSRLQLAQLGVGLAGAILPEGGRLGTLAGVGAQLLFLKFSRQDELEADELGTRYMIRVGENPQHLIEVMEMLEQVSRAAGGGTLPDWLSTHPSPGNRKANLAHLIGPLDVSAFRPADTQGYLRRIDGLIYGSNPREGFVRGSVFYHPELRFRIDFPAGWTITNQKQAVVGVSADERTALQITLSGEDSAEAALADFYARTGISPPPLESRVVNNLPAASGPFVLDSDRGTLEGVVTCIEYERRIYQLIGFGTTEGWAEHGTAAQSSVNSFARLTDPQALAVQPLRLQMLRVQEPASLEELYRRRPSPVTLQELALLNRVQPGTALEAGHTVKWVVGQRVD